MHIISTSPVIHYAYYLYNTHALLFPYAHYYHAGARTASAVSMQVMLELLLTLIRRSPLSAAGMKSTLLTMVDFHDQNEWTWPFYTVCYRKWSTSWIDHVMNELFF